MKDLKGKYVHCETMDQAKELMKEAEKQGFIPLDPSDLQEYYENTVYNFSKPDREVWYGLKEFYESYGLKVVEFNSILEATIQ